MKKAFTIDRLIGLGILIALLSVSLLDPYPVEYLREKSFDLYQRVKPRSLPQPEDRLVAIVDVDEQSLREIGQWPWSRKTIAQLVTNLNEMGAGAIAFDMVFPEPDRLNPAFWVDSLEGIDQVLREKILAAESNDEVLGRVLSGANVVLGRAGYWNRLPNDLDQPPKRAIAVRKLNQESPEPTDSLVDIPTLVGNLPVLEKNAKGVGVFAFLPRLDGILRQVLVVGQNNGKLYPSLALEAIRVGLQVPTVILEVDPNGISGVAIAPRSLVKPEGLKISTDENGQARPYFAPSDPSLYISAADVLKRRVDQEKITAKIIFVGSSAPGLLDIRATPISAQIPGVEIHAQVVENILAVDREIQAIVPAKQFLTRSKLASKGGEIIFVAIGGLLMIILTPILGATRSLLVFFLLAAITLTGSWYLFSVKYLLVDATFSVLTFFLLYSTLTYLGLSSEELAKRQIRNAFSMYLSPDMVDAVAKNPEQLKLGGQMREMTLLFCDVRGFTTISEQFDAEGLTHLINKLLSPLTGAILEHKGTVDKYMGDCIMAFWNAPLDDIFHAKHACIAALKMIELMEPLNSSLEAEAKANGQRHIPLKVGIGLNSGECVVGNMGSDQRFDYSVLGDAVNLASRLEGQSKNYGVDIVIGESTKNQVPTLATIELDNIKVKGKTKAVRIYALIGDEKMAETPDFQSLKKMVDIMLLKWRGQDWQGARVAIDKARELGKLYSITGFFDLYDWRVAEYQNHPPGEEWDGVFEATTK